jgi:predicted phage-related endonuclease
MGTNTNGRKSTDRRSFIGGSDARIIMGDDEAALVRLWREKRGEVEPKDLSGNLIVQLGVATEALNRRWYETNTGRVITDVQKRVRHPAIRWMAATLDGRLEGAGTVFEAKFMLPWSFSEQAAAEKYMPQLQHNMWVVAARQAVLSVITGGGKWVEITANADPLYQHLIVTAEPKILALCRERRAPSPVRSRTTQAPDRGDPHRGYGELQCLGRVCRRLHTNAGGPPGARAGQDRAQKLDAGRCSPSDWTRNSREALEIRCREL